MERCLREIAAIEAELRARNPDVTGLLLELADWNAELRILRDEERAKHDEGKAENREARGELLPASAVPPIVHHINFIDDDGKTTETIVIVHPGYARRPVKHIRNRRWGR